MVPLEVLKSKEESLPPRKIYPRNELTLENKVALIKESDGCSYRKLAEKYKIGRTQVSNLIKRRKRYLEAFENNEPTDSKRPNKSMTYEYVDKITWEWFQCRRSKFLPVSGMMMQVQAKKIASQLGQDDFKASSGWLNSFKKRHNISGSMISNERSTVYIETVDGWDTQLCDITSGFEPGNIFSTDETCLVYHALPCRSFIEGGLDIDACEDRVTVSLAVNMIGEFEDPIVIGRDVRPRCFKNLTMDKFPFKWHANPKAWMTSTIFNQWLSDFNSRMKSQNRDVILFLDNAFSHSHQSNGLSNVKLIFVPADKSAIHPLNQGIIHDFKTHYRRHLLSHLLTQLDETNNIMELSQSVSILNACEWIAAAAKSIKAETVQQSFKKAGFYEALHCDTPDEGPQIQLNILVAQASSLISTPILDPREYVSLDDSIPTSEELVEDWEENLVSEWLSNSKGPSQITVKKEVDEDTAGGSGAGSTAAITTLKQALQNVRDQKDYAIEMGFDNIYRKALEMEEEYVALLTDQKQITYE